MLTEHIRGSSTAANAVAITKSSVVPMGGRPATVFVWSMGPILD